MLIKRPADISAAEITPEPIYRQRRRFIEQSATLAGVAMTGVFAPSLLHAGHPYAIKAGMPTYSGPPWLEQKLGAMIDGAHSTTDALTPYKDVIRYNNFYEFGPEKHHPARLAQEFNTDPWRVEIAGEAETTGVFTLEDILRPHTLEDRIYRLRCVEAWSMVVPWVGFPLGDLLQRFGPNSRAKYVEFTTLVDPDQLPGQASAFSTIDWPYVEGLRIDEAMHPLTLLAVGLYGKSLPPQNGAPLRLVVPWKYGFKSIKSIVRIRFTERPPVNTWQRIAPGEYGFYANVNPAVDHPRWSQKTERRLPGGIFNRNVIDTQPFNGYGDQVASLYTGMDLRQWF